MKSENEITTIGTSEVEVLKHRIYEVRGLRVMLDRDLAELYGVETKVLNQAVKRNIDRFPEDFMFKLNKSEWAFLRSQIVTLKESPLSTNTEAVDFVDTSLRLQIVTLNNDEDGMSSQIVMTHGRGQHSKYLPYAFTELGIARVPKQRKKKGNMTKIQVIMLNNPIFKGVELDHFRRQNSSKSMGMETKRQQKTVNHKSCGQIF